MATKDSAGSNFSFDKDDNSDFEIEANEQEIEQLVSNIEEVQKEEEKTVHDPITNSTIRVGQFTFQSRLKDYDYNEEKNELVPKQSKSGSVIATGGTKITGTGTVEAKSKKETKKASTVTEALKDTEAINPITGKKIQIHGSTCKKYIKDGILALENGVLIDKRTEEDKAKPAVKEAKEERLTTINPVTGKTIIADKKSKAFKTLLANPAYRYDEEQNKFVPAATTDNGEVKEEPKASSVKLNLGKGGDTTAKKDYIENPKNPKSRIQVGAATYNALLKEGYVHKGNKLVKE